MTAVRVGVVGCGAITRREHVPLLQAAGAELTAFWSRRRTSAELAASLAGGGAVEDDWRSLVGRDDVDAVVVATPNVLHAEQALAAVSAGKHVLVEKPFTVTVEDADRLLAAADRAGVVLMAAHNVRFASPLLAARAAVAAGTTGDVTSFRAAFCHAGPLAWSAEASWFLDPVLAGGGALLDLGVHLVDALRFVLDDEVEAVSAVLSGVANGIEQDAFALLETRSGLTGALHAGWRSRAGRDFSLLLLGERGTLRVGAEGVTVTDLEGVARPVPLPAGGDTVQDAFVRAVRGGRAEGPDGHDGRAAVAVVQAAYEAARTGRRSVVPR